MSIGPSSQFEPWSEKDLDFTAARQDRLVPTQTATALPGASARSRRRAPRAPSVLRTGKPIRTVLGVVTGLVELGLLYRLLAASSLGAELTNREPTQLDNDRLLAVLVAAYAALWVVTMLAMLTNRHLAKTSRWGWFWYSRSPFGTAVYWLVEPRPAWWRDDRRDTRVRRSGLHAFGVFLCFYFGLPLIAYGLVTFKNNLGH